MSGALPAVMEHIPDSRARNELLAQLRQLRVDAAEAQATQARAQKQAVLSFCDSVARLTRRLDALELKHADERRRKAKADAEREAKAIADYISQLPDPDNPSSYGEDPLTTHGPSAPEDEQQLRAITTDDTDNVGDLPEELTMGAPPPPANYPTLGQPPRAQVSQPVSVSLDEQ
jgi:hypothetical protein